MKTAPYDDFQIDIECPDCGEVLARRSNHYQQTGNKEIISACDELLLNNHYKGGCSCSPLHARLRQENQQLRRERNNLTIQIAALKEL